jgi:hypothetical protein
MKNLPSNFEKKNNFLKYKSHLAFNTILFEFNNYLNKYKILI